MTTLISKTGQQNQQYNTWALANKYRSGDVVIYGGATYQANDAIAANTAFAVGTAGATWLPINNGGMAEWGQAVLTQGDYAVTGAYVDLAGSSFTLPSAGVWEVTYHIRTVTTLEGGYLPTQIVKSSDDSVVANSGTLSGYSPGIANFQPVGSQTVYITTTGSETYKLQGRAYARTITVTSDSKVVWTKIAGSVPMTGSVLPYATMGKSTAQAVNATAQDLTWDVRGGSLTTASTTVSLLAGVTYEMNVSLAGGLSGSTTSAIYFKFVNGSTGATLGLPEVLVLPVTYTGGAYAGFPSQSVIYTPSSNMTVKLTSSSTAGSVDISANSVWTVKQIGTTSTSAFTGTLTGSWSINNSYPSGTIVVYGSQLYQANDVVPTGTAFTVGTTGATWTQIATNGSVAENGKVTTITNQSTTSTSLVDVTGSTFTLPSAGVWSVTYDVGLYCSNASYGMDIVIADSSNSVVTSSRARVYATSAEIPTSRTVQITTTGSAQFKLRYSAVNGGTANINADTDRAGLFWNKISGFTSAVGAVSGYLSYTSGVAVSAQITNGSLAVGSTLTNGVDFANMGSVSAGGMTYNTGAGTFTLKAGVTYEIFASIRVDSPVNNTTNWNNTSTTLVNSSNVVLAGTTIDTLGTGFTLRAHAFTGTGSLMYTPTVDTVCKLRVGYCSDTTNTMNAIVTVKQIGTTNATAFVGALTPTYSVSNTYPSGTIVVKDGIMYQANATVYAGTTFAIGTTGATWTALTSAATQWTATALSRYSTNTYTWPGSAFGIVQVIYNVAENDTTGFYNTSNGRFTPTKAGFWTISCGARIYGGTSTSENSLVLEKNGSKFGSNSGFGMINGTVSKTIYMNGTTDYITVGIFTNQISGTVAQEYQNSFFTAVFNGS